MYLLTKKMNFFVRNQIESQTFVATLLITDVHIDVIHNIERYDQLAERYHDMQLMRMRQMQLDFVHPIFNSSF